MPERKPWVIRKRFVPRYNAFRWVITYYEPNSPWEREYRTFQDFEAAIKCMIKIQRDHAQDYGYMVGVY